MNLGHFYFLTDQYFIDFPDPYLMSNHETVNSQGHDRPCFYAIYDNHTGTYWVVPFSSQVRKFKEIYNSKVKKYGKCDTIDFACVLGQEKAFLIQNMCPVTQRYIKNEYLSKTRPVCISRKDELRIVAKAKKILALHRKGVKLIFPDVISIEQKLIAQNTTVLN